MSWERSKRRREAKTGEKTGAPGATSEGGSPSESSSQRRLGTSLEKGRDSGWEPNAGRRHGRSRSSGLCGRLRSPKDEAKWSLDGTGLRTHHAPCTEAELSGSEGTSAPRVPLRPTEARRHTAGRGGLEHQLQQNKHKNRKGGRLQV